MTLIGNEGGYLHLLNEGGNKDKVRLHHKPIRALEFVEKNKIITGSEDG